MTGADGRIFKRSRKLYDEIALGGHQQADHAALNDNAILLVKNGEYAEAEACYRKSIISAPDFASWYNLGILLTDMGRSEEAIDCYQQSLRLYAGSHKSLNNLAVVFNSRKEYEQALIYIERSCHAAEEVRNGINKAVILKNMGKIDDALAVLRSLEKNAPDDSRFLYNTSNLYCIKGDIAAAEKYAVKAYQSDKTDDYAAAALARVYVSKNDMEQFYFYLEEALRLGYPIWKEKNLNSYEDFKNENRFKTLIAKYQQ